MFLYRTIACKEAESCVCYRVLGEILAFTHESLAKVGNPKLANSIKHSGPRKILESLNLNSNSLFTDLRVKSLKKLLGGFQDDISTGGFQRCWKTHKRNSGWC